MINKCQAKKQSDIEKLKKEIGERIVDIRKASETKRQKNFTKKMGISQAQISAIECGRSTLSIKVLNQIMHLRMDGRRINIDWLFTGRGEMMSAERVNDLNIDDEIYRRLAKLDPKKKEAILELLNI